MLRYETVKSMCWKNTKTNQTASIYGAVPYTNVSDKDDWEVVERGFTVRDIRFNTVGMGRQPFETKEACDQLVDKLNNI